jgi:hypothetical protein
MAQALNFSHSAADFFALAVLSMYVSRSITPAIELSLRTAVMHRHELDDSKERARCDMLQRAASPCFTNAGCWWGWSPGAER